jgi:hypothetical protein
VADLTLTIAALRRYRTSLVSAAQTSSPATDRDVGAHWRTPPDLAERIRAELNLPPWSVDLAATRESTLAPRYFGPDHSDPLRRDTLQGMVTLDLLSNEEVAWCNPPYSRQGIDRWIAFVVEAAARGLTVVTLTFARTDCAWFHDLALRHASRMLFIRGRVSFLHPSDGQPRQPAGAPSVAILWTGGRAPGRDLCVGSVPARTR